MVVLHVLSSVTYMWQLYYYVDELHTESHWLGGVSRLVVLDVFVWAVCLPCVIYTPPICVCVCVSLCVHVCVWLCSIVLSWLSRYGCSWTIGSATSAVAYGHLVHLSHAAIPSLCWSHLQWAESAESSNIFGWIKGKEVGGKLAVIVVAAMLTRSYIGLLSIPLHTEFNFICSHDSLDTNEIKFHITSPSSACCTATW